ncbi:nucleotide reductase [Vibrio phage vB_VpaM_R16F]|nr:nucleotide reductase [Vibrio phage vB_VpaM_R16F]
MEKIDLTEVLKFIEKQDDSCADSCIESAIEEFNFLDSYREIEESEWTQDYKYQSNEVIFELELTNGEKRYIELHMSRSGSPFTDWYYTVGGVYEVDKFKGNSQVSITISGEDHEYVARLVERAVAELLEDLEESNDVVIKSGITTNKGW